MNVQNDQAYQALQSLSIAEKRMLGEALVACADTESSIPLVTDAQRTELRIRLAHHRVCPEEVGISFEQLKAILATRL